MSLQACMGGWCTKRQHCLNYHSEDRREPEERLCEPGRDGQGIEHSVVLQRQVGEWERAPGLMATVGWMEMLA